MIPDEAVEAAAKVFYQDGWEGPPFWESLDADDPSRLEYLATARAALDAAAPHMLAQAVEDREEVEARVKSIVQDVAMTVDYTDRLYAAVRKIMAVTRG